MERGLDEFGNDPPRGTREVWHTLTSGDIRHPHRYATYHTLSRLYIHTTPCPDYIHAHLYETYSTLSDMMHVPRPSLSRLPPSKSRSLQERGREAAPAKCSAISLSSGLRLTCGREGMYGHEGGDRKVCVEKESVDIYGLLERILSTGCACMAAPTHTAR